MRGRDGASRGDSVFFRFDELLAASPDTSLLILGHRSKEYDGGSRILQESICHIAWSKVEQTDAPLDA